jgi:hypothetical protein
MVRLTLSVTFCTTLLHLKSIPERLTLDSFQTETCLFVSKRQYSGTGLAQLGLAVDFAKLFSRVQVIRNRVQIVVHESDRRRKITLLR